MKLNEYLFRSKTTRTEFATKIGISRVYLSNLINGLRSPSVKLARKIEEVTGGKVSKEEVLFPEEFEEPKL